MSDNSSIPFEPCTPRAKTLMTAVQEAANQLGISEQEWYKKVSCKRDELRSRSAELAKRQEVSKKELAEFEQQKKTLEEALSKFSQDHRNFYYQMSHRAKHFQQQKDDYETAVKQVRDSFEDNRVIEIDVGNYSFKTNCKTLCRFPNSLLAQLVRTKPDAGRVFIDRNGQHFNFILKYLRNSENEEQILDQIAARKYNPDLLMDILEEAKYYELQQLVKILNWAKFRHDSPYEMPYLVSEGLFVTDGSYTHVTKEPPSGEEINLRKMNFTDSLFEQVHFKHKTSFQGSVLQRATFSKCKFEAVVSFIDTDLRKAKFIDCEFTIPILVTGANKKGAVLPLRGEDYSD